LIGQENAKNFGFDFTDKGNYPNRLFIKGDCDDVILKIIKAAGWEKEFETVLE
jgi:hypothetical protein